MVNRAIILLGKYPEAGKVKTRLASGIGDQKAVDFYKKCFEKTLKEISEIGLKLECYFFYGGENFEKINKWVGDKLTIIPPKYPDVNKHLNWAFNKLFDLGFNQIICLSSDVPGLNSNVIRQSFNRLREYEVVIGPDFEGGIFLFGCKKRMSFLFKNIKKEQKLILQISQRLKRRSISFLVLPPQLDIDTKKDYFLWQKNLKKSSLV